MFNNKVIFVTGGTGSFGQKFIQIILKNYNPKKIIIFSRDELKQYEMQNSLIFNGYNKPKGRQNKLRYFIGDVRDKERLMAAMDNDVDLVVHAAALKQVDTAEYNPFEFVKTNVIGAQNLIDVALQFNVSKVIALSTDKAAAPINLYGATKLTSDKLFISANNYKGSKKICFSVVRYGNVMGSRGSVIPHFLKSKDLGTINITDQQMTRFNITLKQGVDFVIKCMNLMKGSELFIPKIPSYRILDIAKAIAPEAKIKIIGIRSGEKIHEEMVTLSDAITTIEYRDYYVIFPNNEYLKKNISQAIKKGGKLCKEGFSYNSKTNNKFLKIKEIKKLIKEEIDLKLIK